MHIKYDRENETLYIRLRSAQRTDTVKMNDGLLVDVDADGSPIGIEILDPARLGVELGSVTYEETGGKGSTQTTRTSHSSTHTTSASSFVFVQTDGE